MEPGEEEEDLEAIQAHLDMTMALTYEAVEVSLKNSTLPDDMVYETIDTYKPRPPRLGVGATRRDTTANGINSTTMARETARLHGRLAGKKRGRNETDGDVNASTTTNGPKRMHLQEDDSDEEESRTATIVGKGKDKEKVKPLDKFVVRSKQKSKGAKADEPLPNLNGNGNSSIPAPTSPAKINPFSTRTPSEDTRFVAPAPPKSFPSTKSSTRGLPRATSSSTSGELLSPPQSPPRLLSPAISRSLSRSSSASRTSRHSFSLSRRMMLKHQANASWRIVSVEPVVPPNIPGSPLLFKPKEHADTPTKASPSKHISTPTTPSDPPSPAVSLPPAKSKKQFVSPAPVLQLEPLEPSIERGGGVAEDGTGGTQQSQKKKRKRRKKKKNSEMAPLEKNDEEVGEDEDSD